MASTRSGVACTDRHMPYEREGALKISDHSMRGPLLNVNRACQTSHPWTEEELTRRVHSLQNRMYELRNRAMETVVASRPP